MDLQKEDIAAIEKQIALASKKIHEAAPVGNKYKFRSDQIKSLKQAAEHLQAAVHRIDRARWELEN